jgi:hypothetical protein
LRSGKRGHRRIHRRLALNRTTTTSGISIPLRDGTLSPTRSGCGAASTRMRTVWTIRSPILTPMDWTQRTGPTPRVVEASGTVLPTGIGVASAGVAESIPAGRKSPVVSCPPTVVISATRRTISVTQNAKRMTQCASPLATAGSSMISGSWTVILANGRCRQNLAPNAWKNRCGRGPCQGSLAGGIQPQQDR